MNLYKGKIEGNFIKYNKSGNLLVKNIGNADFEHRLKVGKYSDYMQDSPINIDLAQYDIIKYLEKIMKLAEKSPEEIESSPEAKDLIENMSMKNYRKPLPKRKVYNEARKLVKSIVKGMGEEKGLKDMDITYGYLGEEDDYLVFGMYAFKAEKKLKAKILNSLKAAI